MTNFKVQGVSRNRKISPEVTGSGGCNENVKTQLRRRDSCNSSNERSHKLEKKSQSPQLSQRSSS